MNTVWWRRGMFGGAISSLVLWVVASLPALDWVNSTRFVSHVSMATMAFTFFAGYMAAKPTPEAEAEKED